MKNLKDMLNESRRVIDKDSTKKTRELIEEIYPSTSMGDYGLKEMLVSSAMEWMKSYMIEKICEWLESNLCYYDENHRGIDSGNSLIEDFKKAMEK